MNTGPHPPPDAPERPSGSWLVWLLAGTTDQTTTTMRRKVMQVNLGATGIIVTVLGFLAFYLWHGNPGLVRAGLSQLPFALLAPLVWRFNAQGRVRVARWTAFLLAMGGTLAAVVGGLGTALPAHLYFLLFAVLTVMFFPLSEWRMAALLALCNAAAFGWLEVHGWPAHPALAELSGRTVQGLGYALAAGCIAVTMLLSALSEWAADLNEQRLQALADTDGLTGLLNRRAVLALLNQALSRARREGQPLALGLIDVDHFKQVNDAWGHDAGDEVLRHLAGVLRNTLRDYDVAGRVGGEEFVVLMQGVGPAQALASLERLREAVAAQPLQRQGRNHPATISIGAAFSAGPHEAERSLEALLLAADQALYRAKRSGRNRVCAG